MSPPLAHVLEQPCKTQQPLTHSVAAVKAVVSPNDVACPIAGFGRRYGQYSALGGVR